MVNKDFFQALDLLEQEKKISRSKMIEALEAGILFAFKKEYGEARQITVRCDETRNTIKVFAYRNVVETVEDPEKEISLEDAQAIKPSYKLGDVVVEDVTPKDFSRIAAQTAKQVIMQRINDASRDVVMNEMTEREGEIVSATVRRKEGMTYYVEISGNQMEGVLGLPDQIQGERLNIGDVVKVYVKKVRSTDFGAQVVVSRSAAGFVKRMFELEVPEIRSGLVKINGIVREAGYRTKMAVSSDDPSVDAIGACIGPKGSRVNAIVAELGGEKNHNHFRYDYVVRVRIPWPRRSRCRQGNNQHKDDKTRGGRYDGMFPGIFRAGSHNLGDGGGVRRAVVRHRQHVRGVQRVRHGRRIGRAHDIAPYTRAHYAVFFDVHRSSRAADNRHRAFEYKKTIGKYQIPRCQNSYRISGGLFYEKQKIEKSTICGNRTWQIRLDRRENLV